MKISKFSENSKPTAIEELSISLEKEFSATSCARARRAREVRHKMNSLLFDVQSALEASRREAEMHAQEVYWTHRAERASLEQAVAVAAAAWGARNRETQILVSFC